MSAQDFLLEIRTEEIPAPALLPARLELARKLTEALTEEGLPPTASASFATPRRLAVVLRGVPERQEERFSEVLGPPAANAFDEQGTPTRVAQGFAKAQKVDVADLVIVDSPRGKTVAARKTEPGRAAAEILSEDRPPRRLEPDVSEDDAVGIGRALLRAPRARGARALRRTRRPLRPLRRRRDRPHERSSDSRRRRLRGDRTRRLPRQAAGQLRRARRRCPAPAHPRAVTGPRIRGRRPDRSPRRSRQHACGSRRVAGPRPRILRAGVSGAARGDHGDRDAHASEIPSRCEVRAGSSRTSSP